MKLLVQKERKLEDGAYKGVITKVEYRVTEQKYQYTDLTIEIDTVPFVVGYPTIVMKGSALGQLLQRFGVELLDGDEVDPDILIGQSCKCMAMNKKSKKDEKMYTNIMQDSVKPVE